MWEPAPWLRRLSSVLGDGVEADVWAPWALPGGPERWEVVPSRVRTAWRRRVLPVAGGSRVWGLPGWWAVEAGLRWRGRSAAAAFQSRFPWYESHPAEVALAAARGIPVIATDRASGFVSCQRVPRGDVAAVLSELDALDA